jgi:hypothetical protein
MDWGGKVGYRDARRRKHDKGRGLCCRSFAGIKQWTHLMEGTTASMWDRSAQCSNRSASRAVRIEDNPPHQPETHTRNVNFLSIAFTFMNQLQIYFLQAVKNSILLCLLPCWSFLRSMIVSRSSLSSVVCWTCSISKLHIAWSFSSCYIHHQYQLKSNTSWVSKSLYWARD